MRLQWEIVTYDSFGSLRRVDSSEHVFSEPIVGDFLIVFANARRAALNYDAFAIGNRHLRFVRKPAPRGIAILVRSPWGTAGHDSFGTFTVEL